VNWYKTIMAGYANEVGRLHSYMADAFDPYDFMEHLPEYLVEQGMDLHRDWGQGDEDYKWLDEATDEDKKGFRDFIESHYSNLQALAPYEQPPYVGMTHKNLLPATWLVHFTDKAEAIAKNGFVFGHPDMQRGLSYTTYKRDRTSEPGYNFAFDLRNAHDVSMADSDRKYGKDAVVFWGSGVEVEHLGDGEDQVIFWGPSINPEMVFPVLRGNKGWEVRDAADRVVYRAEDIAQAAQWITENFRMLQSTRAKYEPPVYRGPKGEWLKGKRPRKG
jgi:hypothetical protein